MCNRGVYRFSGWWDCAHDMSLKQVWACAALCRSKRDTEPAEELAAVSEWHHHNSGDWSWWLLSYVSALKPGEVDGIKFSAGCYLEIFCARHLNSRLLNITSSVPRRARTTSQRRKSSSPSHHPTSSTIIFLTIKRTNAETNTIILPLQKKTKTKKIKKKAFPLKRVLPSFKTNLLWLYIVNVMLLM